MCLTSHYRKVLEFSYDALDNATSAYKKLKSKVQSLGSEEKETDKFVKEFSDAIANDLNTSQAITVLYDILKSELTNAEKLYLVKMFDSVLSLNLLDDTKVSITDEEVKYIEDMIDKRNEAKKNKDFKLADDIRNELLEKGIVLKDTREGTIYEVIK